MTELGGESMTLVDLVGRLLMAVWAIATGVVSWFVKDLLADHKALRTQAEQDRQRLTRQEEVTLALEREHRRLWEAMQRSEARQEVSMRDTSSILATLQAMRESQSRQESLLNDVQQRLSRIEGGLEE